MQIHPLMSRIELNQTYSNLVHMQWLAFFLDNYIFLCPFWKSFSDFTRAIGKAEVKSGSSSLIPSSCWQLVSPDLPSGMSCWLNKLKAWSGCLSGRWDANPGMGGAGGCSGERCVSPNNFHVVSELRTAQPTDMCFTLELRPNSVFSVTS